MSSRLFPIFVVLLGVSTLARGDEAPEPPAHDAANASFWSRLESVGPDPLSPPLEWYQPLATLTGNPSPFLPAAKAANPVFPSAVVDEATSFADATNGDALLVAHDGVLEIEHYTAQGSHREDHLFSTHSMVRALGAVAIGILMDQKRLASIDQPASVFLPEWRNDARRAITIRQLLTMSSGIQSTFSAAPGSPFMQSYYGADIEKIVANAPLVKEPGKSFFYDNHNNHAIALIVERVSGKSYVDFLSRMIWRPLGAANAQMMLDHPGGRVMAYCCALVTPRDWLRVGEMLLQGGVWRGKRIVSERWVSEMRKPSDANPNFGLQLFLGSGWMNPDLNRQLAKQQNTLEPVHAGDSFYITGAGDINLMVVPSRKLTILRTGNASPAFRFHVIPNLLIDSLDASKPADAWSTLYPYRMNLPPPGPNPTLTTTPLSYWPTARVAGVPDPVALPRQTLACAASAPFDAIDDALARKGSLGFIVYRGGAIVHEHYSGSFDAATRAESASMHKSVQALLIGRAIAEGKIAGIDSPISTWLPEWSGDERGTIKLRNLLQMASGLAPVPFDLSPAGKTNAFLKGSDMTSQVLGLEYKEEPGKVFEYFSQISELMTVILERATGEKYASYLSRELWRPLGARDAFVALDRPGGLARTFASLLAQPDDWVRVGMLFLDDGRVGAMQVVPAGWIDQMTEPSPANPNYGYQIWRASPYQANRAYSTAAPKFSVHSAEPFLAEDMVYFDGAGARRVYISKSNRLVIVRLGDTDNAWDDSWLPNAVILALRQCE
jgi:CubicO group peptidase (beta-lactamase class C family)